MKRVKVTSTLSSKFVPSSVSELDGGVLSFITDVHRAAILLAPKRSRALVNSAKINRLGVAHYSVSFGSALVRYARRRHFENKLHPGTLMYLQRAGDGVSRGDVRKYFR